MRVKIFDLILACGDVDSWAPSSAREQGADIPLYFRTFLQLDVSEGRTQHESGSASFGISWNVDLNRLENEINAFLATLPSNAVKYVQSAASSTRTGDTDQMQTDYLVTVWYEGEPKKPAAKKSARR